MKQANPGKPIRTRTAEELGRALGLSVAETDEMEFRSEFTSALAKIIRNGKSTHAEIAKKAGTSRTRVTAIANGNTQGISTDLLIRVLSATGYKAELPVRKAAAKGRDSDS
jgi:predicted XRE-type DNA-binding protein